MLNYRQSALVRFIARRRALKTQTPGFIDRADSGVANVIQRVSTSDVSRGDICVVSGWVVDSGRLRPPWDIRIEIDGKEVPARIRRELPRLDLPAHLGSPGVLLSGFTALVNTESLAVGPHDLSVRAIVGRYGTAFARIPKPISFFVSNQYSASFAPPSQMANNSGTYQLDPVRRVAQGGVLELTGWACDDRGRTLASVAARIDAGPWNEGWTGVQRSDCASQGSRRGSRAAGFRLRIGLDTVPAGSHELRLAGKTLGGQWMTLGECRPFVVTNIQTPLPPWARSLVDGGDAEITDAAGSRLKEIQLYRLGAAVSFKGTLRRSTEVGRSIGLVARDSNSCEFPLISWSTPTKDRSVILFGGEIPPRALLPETYRLVVDATEASERYVGRADTGCDLVVARSEGPRLRVSAFSVDLLSRLQSNKISAKEPEILGDDGGM